MRAKNGPPLCWHEWWKAQSTLYSIGGKALITSLANEEVELGFNQLGEYISGADLEAYVTLEKFFIEEVVPWAEKKFRAFNERKSRVVWTTPITFRAACSCRPGTQDLFWHVIALQVYACPFNAFEEELKEQKKDLTPY